MINKIPRTNRQDNLKPGVWENNFVRIQDLDKVIDEANTDIASSTASITSLSNTLDSRLNVVEVELSAADIIGMNAAPVTVVAAPGSGKVLEFVGATAIFDYGTVAFTGGGAIEFQNTNTVATISSTINAAFLTGVVDAINSVSLAAGSIEWTSVDGIQITNATAPFATGDGVLRVIVSYRVHDTGL